MCIAFLCGFTGMGTEAMAQRRHVGNRLMPAQQRILQYNKEEARKADSVAAVKATRIEEVRSKAATRLMQSKAASGAKSAVGNPVKVNYYEGDNWMGEHLYGPHWRELEEWEKEEYDWDPERQKDEYDWMHGELLEHQKRIWNMVKAFAGRYACEQNPENLKGTVKYMLPFFEADTSFECSKIALVKQAKLKRAWQKISDTLEENYKKGTLKGEVAYNLSMQVPEMFERLLEELSGEDPSGDLYEMYEREYANKYFGSVVTNQRSNCSGYLYAENFEGEDVNPSHPSSVVFAFFDKKGYPNPEGGTDYMHTKKDVGGYYMIPSDRPSRNPKSWYVLGCVNDSDIKDMNSAQDVDGLTGGTNITGYDWTEPTDDEYDEKTKKTKGSNWIVISHVTNVDLSKMEKDDLGRVVFPAQKPGKFTHVMLFVTDVLGGSDNPNNKMELSGFYTHDNVDFSFTKKKNTLLLTEWPRKVKLGTDMLENCNMEIQANRVFVTIRHDNPSYEITDTLELNDRGEIEFDFSPYHKDEEANKQFPLMIGKMATMYLSCELVDKVYHEPLQWYRQAVPIFVYPGDPKVYTAPLAFDGKTTGETVDYTFTVSNLDPVNGSFLHMTVEDYAAGKLAPNITDIALLPSDMDLEDIDEYYGGEYERTPWLKITRDDADGYLYYDWERVAAKLTAKATVTLPVSCIPYATAYVSAGAANITLEDPYGDKAWQNDFRNTVDNTSFDPNLVKGTWYTYGSSEAPRDLSDWIDNDEGLGEQIVAGIRANIEKSEVVDSLLQLEKFRFTKVLNFECPVAWGDISINLKRNGASASKGSKGEGDVKVESDDELVRFANMPYNNFTISVNFPDDNTESVLELSWQEGKIKREFHFTGKKANILGLYSFTPIVHGDENDEVHTVTLLAPGALRIKRSGHFSKDTKHRDNKIFLLQEDYEKFLGIRGISCILESNGFISRGSNMADHGLTQHSYVGVWHNPWISSAIEPSATLMENTVTFNLRADANTARLLVVNERGEPLTDCDIKYAFTKETLGQNGKQMGTSMENPLFVKAPSGSKIMHVLGDNLYTLPAVTSDDPEVTYNLMAEVGARGYNTQLICEALNGPEFRRCVETGDAYTCVLKKTNEADRISGSQGHTVSDVFLRDKELYPFADSIRHLNLSTVRSMEYVGDGSNNIDLLLRTLPSKTGSVNTYVLAPYEEPIANAGALDSKTIPLEGYLLAMDVANDELNRPIAWKHEDTGFSYDYQLLTCNSQYLLPDLRKDEKEPDGYWLVLWDGKRTWENGHPHTTINMRRNGNGYQSLMWILRGFNYAEDRSEEIAGNAANMLNFKGEDMSLSKKKGDLGFLSTFLDGFCKLDLKGPETVPFSLSLTHQDDHFNLRGQFEINVLDYVPVYSEYMKANKFQMKASEFQKQYLATKHEFVSSDKMKAMKVAQGVNAFIGFKGFFDAGLYHSDDFKSWKPYFNDLAVRLEASASVKTPESKLSFANAGLSLQAALYAQFMLANPAADDPLLNGRNPLSHFNLYYTMGASIDIAAWAEAGMDLGFIAAMAGIRGAAGASMEFTALSRPWYNDGFDAGMRFNAYASLYAYARVKFLFWEKSYEKKFFDVDATKYWPDDPRPVGGNPYQFDPNLKDGIESPAKAVAIRPAFTNYSKRYSAPELKAVQVLNGIDAYSNPTYYGRDGKIAYFSLNTPNNVMDDRIVIKDGTKVTEADKDNCAALSFSTATAPGSDKTVMAIQRLRKDAGSVDASNMSDENKQNVGNSTQILAITNGNYWDANEVISERGVTNMSPKAAIDADGNWAVVWPSGEMKFADTEEGSEPYIVGDLMMYSVGEYYTSKPQSVALLDSLMQINDYAVGISKGMPFVWATIPEADDKGNIVPNVYGIINDNGIVRQMCLGIRGSNHQIIQLTDGRFIAASREITDSIGIDVTLYEGWIENSTIKLKKLGSLGLNKYNVTNYKLFASRKGAASANDLYVVWNQHDTEVLDAQTLAATSSNNCFVAQVSTTNGLSVSYPTKLCTLKDEESVVNIDAYASDNNEVTALICVTGAGKDASTGAYVLEIDSKIDNAVAAIEANLEAPMAKGTATDIRLTVRNEGHDPITSLDADINSVKATAPVNIKPGDLGYITVRMPAGTDFTETMNYVINATFTNADTKKTEVRDCGDAFSLEVADIAAELLYNQLDTTIAKSVVTAAVKNLTPGKYRDGYTVKAGIYLDANGHNLYPRTALYEIPASEFTNDGLNSIPVNFLVPTQKEESMVYLIVQTVAEDGTVVQDQVKSNNIVALNIEAYEKDITTATEEQHLLSAEDFEKPLLTVRNDGDAIIISNIDTDNDVKVYGPGGSLIHWTKAEIAKKNGGTVRIPNIPHGVILVTNSTRAGKILH